MATKAKTKKHRPRGVQANLDTKKVVEVWKKHDKVKARAARELGVSLPAVTYHLKKAGVNPEVG